MSRMPEVGEEVDDVFRVEEELDHGNFGAIYRVHDILEDRTLALKVQKPGPHDDQEVRQRFEREARLIYSLDHRNVVEVMYYGQTGEGLPYMAMEFLEGTDLEQLLRGGYEFERAQIKRIGLETLSALKAAHEVGIVHRDLKPANIFLVDDGEQGYVKVLDFGFAKALDDESAEQITRANTLVGSPAYMAPELVHKEDVGPHSDLYAIGLILAEMITGEKVVQVDGVYDTIVFQGSEEAIDLAPAVEHGPFGGVVQRAVRKGVDRRYGSAEQMIADLEKIDIESESVSLQEHAEVENEQAAPFVLGEADPDAATKPGSQGMPSVDESDQEIGAHADGASESRGNDASRTTGGMSVVDPPSDGEESPPMTSGGRTRVDPAPRRTDNPGTHQTMPPRDKQELDLEFDDSAPGTSRNAEPSLLREILLGVALGGLALAIILTILYVTR